MPKYSNKPFDQAGLNEYDQKDKLLKLMQKSKSYDKHPYHKALYDALVLSLIVDEDDMDKKLEDQSTSKKRRQDDQDQDPSADETIHDVEIETREFVKDDVLDVEDPTQANASAPKQYRSTWFKIVVVKKPESPDAEWHKEPTIDDTPEQTWFNEMVNVEKNQRTFDDVIGSIIDFTNFTKNCLRKDKITKANLEGPAFKLMEGRHKNYIELEYNFEQCYLALKPLPLHGAPDRLTILVDFFFNKDLEYLTTGNVEKKYATSLKKPKAASHWGPKRKLFYRARQAVQSSHKVYSWMKILSIVRMSIDKQFGYGYLKEIIVRRVNQKEYTIKEADFPRLHLNDIEDMYLLYGQNKLHHLTCNEEVDMVRCAGLDNKEPYTIFHKPRGVVYLNKDEKKYLMREDVLYKFGDGTLKKACQRDLGLKRSKADRVYAEGDKEDIVEKTDHEEFRVFCGCQNRRDLPRDTPIDRVEVLRHDTNGVNVRLGKCYTRHELSQEQHGDNKDALVNIEEVEELKRIVRIKGVKKEALHTLR
ncbi:hypothetical protein Tco_0280507 [Tanacetum coccineum]